nr:hypothetical protein [Tanacetum cinerariifolium]
MVDPGSDDAKKNNIVKGLLFQSIPKDLVLQIGNLKTGKEMWEAIKTRNLGVDHAYAVKFLGIASKSATLGEVMSEHKLVKKFLTSLPRHFVHIVAALEQVLDLLTSLPRRFVHIVAALETEYSNGNNDSSEGREHGSYSRGRGRGRGQRRGRGNSQTKVNVTPRKTVKIIGKG